MFDLSKVPGWMNRKFLNFLETTLGAWFDNFRWKEFATTLTAIYLVYHQSCQTMGIPEDLARKLSWGAVLLSALTYIRNPKRMDWKADQDFVPISGSDTPTPSVDDKPAAEVDDSTPPSPALGP